MPEGYITQQALEAGPFNNILSKVTFDLQANGLKYDLSRSYIDIVARVTSSDGSVYPMAAYPNTGSSQTMTAQTNATLVRDAMLSTAKQGTIELNRNVHIRQTITCAYENPYDQMVNSGYRNAWYQPNVLDEGTSLQQLSPFVEINTVGTIPSQYVDCPIRIPLTALFDLAKLDCWDIDKTGRTRIELTLSELLESFTVQPHGLPVDSVGNTETVDCEDVPVATTGTQANLWTMSADPTGLYVGQPVQINYDEVGAPTVHACTITEIEVSDDAATSSQFKLTLDPPIPVTAGQDLTSVEVDDAPALPTLSLAFQRAEISLYLAGGTMPKKVQYITTSCEDVSNSGGGVRFQRLFQAEPESQGIIFGFLRENNSIQSVLASPMTSYRLSVDGDGIQRDVLFATPLYFDRMSQGLARCNVQALSMWPMTPDNDARATQNDQWNNGQIVASVCEPLPIKPQVKQVQLEAQFGTGAGAIPVRILAWKFLRRQVEF